MYQNSSSSSSGKRYGINMPMPFIHSVHVMFFIVGLNIVEVAHDNQPVVKKYVTDELNLLNSYDTWHGK